MRPVQILRYPDARLRRRAEPLPSSAFGTPGIARLAQEMASALASLPEEERCDVLAGTQLDIEPAWRV
jgi:hypothetical protein